MHQTRPPSTRPTTATTHRIRTSAIAATIALCLAGAAHAQDKPVALKLSTWVPAQHPLNPSLTAWAADITKASGGTITATLFPSEQLGKAFDHYDMAKDGIADFAWISPGYQPGRFPVMAGAGLPFLFSNAKGGSAAIDAWYRPYALKEMKDVKVCFAFVHDPGTFHSKKKLLSPTDVKGLKVRPATGTVGQMVSLLGGTNVQASAPEARDALERGVADAITFPWGSILLFGIDKAVTQHMDVPLYTTPFVWAMNKDKYESMSAAQKKVIDDHCTSEWAEKVATPWAEFESSGRTKLAAMPGHDAYKLTPEQLDAWRKAIAPTEAEWAAGATKAGYDPKQVMDSLKAALAKYKAGL
jgi:TRAP-type C4-dicarboxylate transport system substrate-binding protein